MARLTWSMRAAEEFEEICDYIGRDSEHHARLVAERINTAASQICDFPEAGSIVPEYNRPDVRERLVHSFRIIYRIRSDRIQVITVMHGARRLPLDLDDE